MKTLILALAVLATVLMPPAAAAAPTGGCQVAELASGALTALGETRTEVQVVTRSQMELDTPGAAAYADHDRIVIADDLACRWIKATIAHEVAHVWQFRSGDEIYTQQDEYDADCVAASTGWDDYAPYLTQRGYSCTDQENATADTLKGWAR